MFQYYKNIILQFILPHKLISKIALICANNKVSWIKNYLINYFIKRYPVKMQEAMQPDPLQYQSFNDFFTRKLLPNVRPLETADLIMPADGILAAYGDIKNNSLLQAKGFHYSVQDLLNEHTADNFSNGSFATIYLAPHDYHRVHMPLTANLNTMHYIAGKLFSVSLTTTNNISNIFTKNERVVCIFDTEQYGKVAVVLVGAMIVGGITTTWAGQICPPHAKKGHIQTTHYKNINDAQNITLQQQDELGYFSLGSTVIVTTENKVQFKDFTPQMKVIMGQALADFI